MPPVCTPDAMAVAVKPRNAPKKIWGQQCGFGYICPAQRNLNFAFYFQHTELQYFMKYKIDKQDTYAVLTLDEENLNSALAPQLKTDLILFREEGVRNLIFDLSSTKFVDSSGLSAILTGHRLWKEPNSFVLAGELHPMVKKLIEISRLETILTIIPTVSEAVDYVMMEEIERELSKEE